MNDGYSLNHLVLNQQRNLWGENRIIDIIDSKTDAAKEIEILNLDHVNFPGQIMPLVKIGNTFTVPFFKK
jgi:hypothetical protein